jgi:hypothetical protein
MMAIFDSIAEDEKARADSSKLLDRSFSANFSGAWRSGEFSNFASAIGLQLNYHPTSIQIIQIPANRILFLEESLNGLKPSVIFPEFLTIVNEVSREMMDNVTHFCSLCSARSGMNKANEESTPRSSR